MHNLGSMGQHDAQPWIHGPEVCTTLDPWASMMHNHGSIGRAGLEFHRVIHGGRDWLELRAGTRCSSLDGCQGTWLEFHRVINADRASMMQTSANAGPGLDAQPWIPGPEVCTTLDPWAGTRCSSLNRFHGGRDWLELRAGTRCSSLDGSHGRGLDAVPSMDPRGPGWSSIE